MLQFALGPLLYYWDNPTIETFYHAAQDSSASIIYLGETVCSKRRDMKLAQWLDVARTLQQAGKQVVLSTLALIQSPSELKEMQKWIDNGTCLIEANDLGAVQLAYEHKLPFVCGPAINCYNVDTLQLLLQKGMKRWVMPVELSRDWLSTLLAECEQAGIRQQFEVEVFAYGHLPLAYSARCFTARALDKAKDVCECACQHYPEGITVNSQDGNAVFVLNGIQTQSGYCYNLINQLPELAELVDVVRLSPEPETLTWLERFAHPEHQHYPLPQHDCNGYWLRLPGMIQQQ